LNEDARRIESYRLEKASTLIDLAFNDPLSCANLHLIFPTYKYSIAPMKIIATTHSSFPRIGEGLDEQKLRRAYTSLEKKKIGKAEFEEIQDGLVKEFISIQESAGCGLVTDGMIRWYDHASHIAGHLRGFEINGLLRFFDTNYYFRQPIAGDEIGEGDGGLADETAFVIENAALPVKSVLLGPYSLAKMCRNKSSMKFEGLCHRLAEILGFEVERMASKGTDYIQIEEPAFAREPKDFELLRKTVDIMGRKKGKAKLILTFYFGDCTPLIDRLPEIPADMFGLDFTYSPGLSEKLIKRGCPGPVSLGILDGRNTKMEKAEKVAISLKNILAESDIEECHVTTSCGLEFLPRQYALKKLELTSKVAGILNG